jgi:hypothetical protein
MSERRCCNCVVNISKLWYWVVEKGRLRKSVLISSIRFFNARERFVNIVERAIGDFDIIENAFFKKVKFGFLRVHISGEFAEL